MNGLQEFAEKVGLSTGGTRVRIRGQVTFCVHDYCPKAPRDLFGLPDLAPSWKLALPGVKASSQTVLFGVVPEGPVADLQQIRGTGADTLRLL